MTALERRDNHPRAAIVLGAGYPDRPIAGAAVPQEPTSDPERPHPGFARTSPHANSNAQSVAIA